MSGYWTQFARTGDPNHKGLPTWPAYDPQKDVYLEIGRDVTVQPIHHVEKFPLFERSLQARIAEYQKPHAAEKH
jgi:para-nitrobenzyl esterase